MSNKNNFFENDLSQNIKLLKEANNQKSYNIRPQITPALLLVSQSISFYFRNFSKIFFLGLVYFILSSFSSFYIKENLEYKNIEIPIICLLIFIYITTIVNLSLEEEYNIKTITKYSIKSLFSNLYNFLVLSLVIYGIFISVVLVPEFLIFDLYSKNIFIVSLIFFFLVSSFYFLSLFCSIDEKKYGLRCLLRSAQYSTISFFRYLWRLFVLALSSMMLYHIMNYLVNIITMIYKILIFLFDFKYDIFALEEFLITNGKDLKINLGFINFNLEIWFTIILFVIPFIVYYLNSLYLAFSSQQTLSSDFSGSLIHRLFLLFCISISLIFLAFS